jgi:hypothetical protein
MVDSDRLAKIKRRELYAVPGGSVLAGLLSFIDPVASIGVLAGLTLGVMYAEWLKYTIRNQQSLSTVYRSAALIIVVIGTVIGVFSTGAQQYQGLFFVCLGAYTFWKTSG